MKNKKLYFKRYYQKNKDKLKDNIKQWQLDNKTQVNNYKQIHKNKKRKILTTYINNIKSSSSCKHCGEKTVCCLDFHHRDKKNKTKNINKFVADGSSIEKLTDEINKCDIVCSNCHRKIHFSKVPTDRTFKFKFVYSLKKTSMCKFCAESHYSCLDFHHLTNKISTVGRMIKNKTYTLDDVKLEISKCIVVCTNCHRKIHDQLIKF